MPLYVVKRQDPWKVSFNDTTMPVTRQEMLKRQQKRLWRQRVFDVTALVAILIMIWLCWYSLK